MCYLCSVNKREIKMENLEIDYYTEECTDMVAYVIKTWNEQGRMQIYVSPYVFSSVEDAYHAACIDISGK